MLKMPSLPAVPRLPAMSYPVKMTVFGASLGVALIAVLASYFRRRKRRPAYRDLVDTADIEVASIASTAAGAGSGLVRRYSRRDSQHNPHHSRSPNGDIPGLRGAVAAYPLRHNRSNSSLSMNTSDLSTVTLVGSTSADVTNFTAEQLCDLGLESLQTSINLWEQALEKLDSQNDTVDGEYDAASEELSNQLHQLLERTYRLQDQFQSQLFHQMNANIAVDSAVQAITEMDRVYSDQRSRHSSRASIGEDSSDLDSFVSASDMADLTDLEDQVEEYQHLVLYEAGLLELKHGSVPYRTLRTRMVNCLSDTEFLAKLHCIRLALQNLFKDESIRDFFTASGRQMIADLLVKAERDPEEFTFAYDDLMTYVKAEENQREMSEELRGRGVKMVSFYDVVIDFILFDAFDDLENPPSSVTTVVQNRWLSNGFKETALSTAVWSVLKAKRRMLKFPKGFISHFYCVSEHVSPVLAWGFLGPPGPLKDLCNYFKEQVMAFMRDMFDFDKVHYTSVEALADDILRLSKDRIAIASAKLAS